MYCTCMHTCTHPHTFFPLSSAHIYESPSYKSRVSADTVVRLRVPWKCCPSCASVYATSLTWII